jgi:N-acetylglucosamine kinase-like BadF-type ATPase
MANAPTFYLCVDCGGTKTAAVVVSQDGTLLARTLSGGSNVTYLGIDAFLFAVGSAVANALATALAIPPITLPIVNGKDASGTPVPPFIIAAAWLGVSGLDSPATAIQLEPLVASLLGLTPPRLVLSNDTHLLASPVSTLSDVRSAAAIIGGTGSIVVTFREAFAGSSGEPLEQIARTGGYGWMLGDEGGGFDVGRTAIRMLCLQRDAESAGEPPQAPLASGRPLLRERVLARFGVTDALDLLGAVHVADPSSPPPAGAAKWEYAHYAREARLSSLSPLVFESAFEDGDLLARAVLEECAGKLAVQIGSILARPGGPTSVRSTYSNL